MIEGEIIYNKYELKDGNFTTIASILATRIQKLWNRRNEPDTETTTKTETAQATAELWINWIKIVTFQSRSQKFN